MENSSFYPDVSGYYLKNALKIINECGVEIVDIKITAPPRCRSKDYDDDFRVLRIRSVGPNKVELVVCNPYILANS
ncbi:MAG TPA: hypothetical protein PK733_08285 [Clostridiales bacterium]|nr:hypothetical protein [Clostridiales bacterium]